MDPQFINIILVIALAAFIVAAVILIIYNYIAEERQATLRKKLIMEAGDKKGNSVLRAERGKEQLAKKLKELEERHKNKSLSFSQKMQQAGIGISEQQFFIASGACGVVVSVILYLIFSSVILSIIAGVVSGVGIGRLVVNTMRQNRLDKFFNDFPNSLDVVVRGVSAGLPLIDCLRVIATDSEEPIRGEIATVLQGTTLGLTLPDALVKMAERVPIPETSFLAVVITIQAKSGGNLAEALANLSKVIRDRKKLRAKANALAQEAKTTAGILGALPFLVFFANYYISPDYIEPLYTTEMGLWSIFGCFVWMGTGALIIRKMIRFEI